MTIREHVDFHLLEGLCGVRRLPMGDGTWVGLGGGSGEFWGPRPTDLFYAEC